MIKKYTQWFWFIGGFAVGFTLISLGHAALPKKAVSLTELRASKASAPDLEDGFARLSAVESRYAESAEQQRRLKVATSRRSKSARN